MVTERSPILPSELIDRICHELVEKDLFHFTLALYDYLHISNREIIRLLRAQFKIPLSTEINSLLTVSNSPYISTENGITALWSSCKWSNNVRGPFTSNAIEKSLKYFCTTVFFLYARLWPFNPFYYQACYPTLEIVKYPCK